MKASEIDIEQTKDLEIRDMVAKMYAVMITPDPTPLTPNPSPGLVERVENIEASLKHRVIHGQFTDGTGHFSGSVTDEGSPQDRRAADI